ncbi:MAG: hypothetical protein K9H26_19280 [Prolixibacteraceae bacterium]|nr:hypothetical protein [Prolixibacteraceae bacterium]
MTNSQLYRIILIIMLAFLSSLHHVNGQKIPDLEFWGIYIVVNDEPFEFKDRDARDLSMHGNLMKATMNIKSIKGSPNFNDPNAYFITYGNKMNPSKGKEPALSELVWDYQVNRYVVKRNIPIKIGPVKDLSDAFKFIPEEPFKSGIFAFHSGRLNATDPFSGTIEANERNDVWTFIITGQSDEAEMTNMEQMIREHEMLVVAEEIRKANKPVMEQWLRLKSLMLKQKEKGWKLVQFIEESLGMSTPETESLKKLIDEFESFYLTEKLLINEEAFISFKKCNKNHQVVLFLNIFLKQNLR